MRLRDRFCGIVAVIAAVAVSTAAAGQPARTDAPLTKADARAVALGKVSAAYFLGMQELPAFTPEEMEIRRAGAIGDDEALAADKALNAWKLCALDSIAHWAELKAGRGEIVDGAMGRCSDIERDYRNHLLKITQDGRLLFDLSFARQMAKSLEETWRPRILAAALDHDLEALHFDKEREREKSGGRRREPEPQTRDAAKEERPST